MILAIKKLLIVSVVARNPETLKILKDLAKGRCFIVLPQIVKVS